MKTLSHTQRKIAKAKMLGRGWLPYITHIWPMMRTIETDKVKTMAVDRYARLYCNPKFVEGLESRHVAYVLLHETCHIVLNHCERFNALVPYPTKRERFAWNIATDLVIYQILHKLFSHVEPPGIVRLDGYIPTTDIRFLDVPGLVGGMDSPQYYSLILPLLPEDAGEDQDGDDQDGEGQALDPADAGSNSDGQDRDYEEESGSVEQAMISNAISECEKRMEEAESTAPGSVPGQLRQSVSVRLRRQPDPFDELRNVVGRSVAGGVGEQFFTYRRLSRRQQANQPRMRGYIRMRPECSIIIDTSGSMSGHEERALTTIAQGLRRVQRPRVVAFDTRVQGAARLSSIKEFSFVGYGGTDMSLALTEEDRTHAPDVIVLVTDGETDWPSTPTRAKVIVALVKKPSYGSPIPSWMKVIDLTREVPSYAG